MVLGSSLKVNETQQTIIKMSNEYIFSYKIFTSFMNREAFIDDMKNFLEE